MKLVQNKDHIIVKRDGREEKFQEEKLRKVLKWATVEASKEHFGRVLTDDFINSCINEILNDTKIKIYNKIKISKLFDEVIKTVENKICEIQPYWDKIAKNLLIQKYYKEIWNIKRNEYPDYLEVVKKGKFYKIKPYVDIFENFTEEEIEKLGKMIDSSRDFGLTSLGIKTFINKYSLKANKTKIFELPQHTLLRLAIKPFIFEKGKKKRLKLIKQRYEDLSESIFSEATPRYNDNDMEASCVLMKTGDDSWSILRMLESAGLYSKHGGGTAVDVSKIRAVGSKIGTSGESDGVIPFVKMIESVISGFKQGNIRRGACAVYFNWWHYEVQDLIMLKDEGGNEEKRARKLQYGVKINRLLIEKAINDEEIYLFDPKETPKLLNTYGKKFDKYYEMYSNKVGIKKKKIKAIELLYLIAKVRLETGNLYIVFNDNVNENSPFKDTITQSNLCTEILLPTKESYVKAQKIVRENMKKDSLKENIDIGEIALCNLSSINSAEWSILDEKRKKKVTSNLLRSHDNLIDIAYYPVKEGEFHNKMFRPIGIGISNVAYYLAKNGKSPENEQELYKAQFDIMEDIYYHLYSAAVDLAKERGKFENYKKTKWKKGWLPIDKNRSLFDKFADENQIKRWEKLRRAIKKYGLRFSTIGAIAPTATSSIVMRNGATEGINPPKKFIAQKTGGINGYQIAPEFWKYRQFYMKQFEVSNEIMLKLAAIRQLFLDQAQSIDTYYTEYSAGELVQDLILAEQLGIKTLYYANSQKEKEVCESCGS